ERDPGIEPVPVAPSRAHEPAPLAGTLDALEERALGSRPPDLDPVETGLAELPEAPLEVVRRPVSRDRDPLHRVARAARLRRRCDDDGGREGPRPGVQVRLEGLEPVLREPPRDERRGDPVPPHVSVARAVEPDLVVLHGDPELAQPLEHPDRLGALPEPIPEG